MPPQGPVVGMEGMLSPWEPLRPSVMELGFKLWENPNLTGSGCEGATGVTPGRALEDLQFSQCECGAGPGPLVLNSCLVPLHFARGQSKPSPAPLTCLAPAPYPVFIPQPCFPGSGLEQNLWLRDSVPRFHFHSWLLHARNQTLLPWKIPGHR